MNTLGYARIPTTLLTPPHLDQPVLADTRNHRICKGHVQYVGLNFQLATPSLQFGTGAKNGGVFGKTQVSDRKL
jgi:hypothetical protein